MRIREVGRFTVTLILVIFAVVAAISCGGSPTVTGSPGPGTKHIGGPDGGFRLNTDGGQASNCKPKTCDELGFTCGPNADGCGHLLQCGTCTGDDYCGGGGYSKCGSASFLADGAIVPPCVPKTCSDFAAGTCGEQSDGCGAVTPSCGGCTSPAFCGGGGASLCGTGTSQSGDAGVCVPKTCSDFPVGTCGAQSDGCGALTANCAGCTNPAFCGGNPSKPGTCGGNNGLSKDGGVVIKACTRKTAASFPKGTCGVQGDGCGGTIPSPTVCNKPAFCGGGGPSLCGGSTLDAGKGTGTTCTKKTCANYPSTCGQQSDGCGGLTANCGTCKNPAFCGGGGKPGVCGGNDGHSPDGAIVSQCVPATCKSLGYTCGKAGDGCGGTIGPCGPDCTAPEVCGGGGKPNVCGSDITCTGLCAQVPKCTGNATTTLTGFVRAGLQESTDNNNVPQFYVPQGTTPDPVPGVLVYIPQSALDPFTTTPNAPKVECNQCGADVSGNPLVFTTTDFNGKFTLSGVPVSKTATDSIPIVIQLGHWRRKYAFPITKTCTSNTTPQDLNLPSTSAEGDIPLTAVSTGSYDPIECVLLKMGVAQNEFKSLATWQTETPVGTAPKAGRVHIYTSKTGGGGNANPGSVLLPQEDETVLMGTGATGSATNGTYMMYDQILLPCWGDPVTKNAAELTNLGYYGDHGGHFFATHYSYSWMNTNANSSLMSVANWDPQANTNIFPNPPNGVPFTGNVSNTVPVTVPQANPGMFVKWLNYVGALSNGNPGGPPPANPTVTITAGRHDVDSVAGQSVNWIKGTDPALLDPMQLDFTFDMPIPTTANPKPTQCGHGIFSDFHVNSASQSNGTTFPAECNGNALDSQERILEYSIWDLSSCVGPPNISTCTKKTCADFPKGTCGQQGDGCGGLTTNCGSCPTGQLCGGAGTANVCAPPGGGSCKPLTCASYPGLCGQESNGCGSVTASCTCPTGQTCGGAGKAGECGTPPGTGTCKPLTCAAYPKGTCGEQSDGCGGLTPDCNPCPTGQTCGGCGVAGQCCTPPSTSCVPQACPASVKCGPAGDGCGGVIASCGTCTPPETCGGGGVSGQCGGSNGCIPMTCAELGYSCGPAGDGCGNLIPNGCGTCPPPESCGGGGVAGQCGGGAGQCVPKTCAELNINCGPAGDGCGNLIPSCGTCSGNNTCGGGGRAGLCGSPIVIQ